MFKQKIDWEYLAKNVKFNLDLYMKYEKYIDKAHLFHNPSVTYSIINYIGELNPYNWMLVSLYNENIDSKFLKKYSDKLCLYNLSKNKHLTKEIVDYYGVDHKDWNKEYFSKELKEDLEFKVNWKEDKLTLDLVKKNKKYIIVEDICKNPTINESIIDFLLNN